MNTKLKAPKGKFRVVGVDTFSNEDWIYGDYNTKEEALMIAKVKGGTMNMAYVYEDAGNRIGNYGTFLVVLPE